jgi:hypothetical protein
VLSVSVNSSDAVSDSSGGGVIFSVADGYVSVSVTVSETRSVCVLGTDSLSVSVDAFNENVWFEAATVALSVKVPVWEDKKENDGVGGGVTSADSVAVTCSESEQVRPIESVDVTENSRSEELT